MKIQPKMKSKEKKSKKNWEKSHRGIVSDLIGIACVDGNQLNLRFFL